MAPTVTTTRIVILYMIPEFRRRGIASGLIRKIIGMAEVKLGQRAFEVTDVIEHLRLWSEHRFYRKDEPDTTGLVVYRRQVYIAWEAFEDDL